jgi:N-acetylglutamate synthase-like GNAT family acetyltransferase
MTIELSHLYRLRKKDVKKATEVFLRAFYNDILLEFVFSDKETREKYVIEYFRTRIKFGILYGEVYATSPNIEGLAVWYHSDRYEITNWKMLRSGGLRLYRNVEKKIIEKMMNLGHFTVELREKNIDRPYWYLAPVGIDPKHQGKGLCSKLVRPMLARCDRENISTALETQLEKNVEIYKRYGYEIIAKTTIPNSDIPHYLMVRHSKK